MLEFFRFLDFVRLTARRSSKPRRNASGPASGHRRLVCETLEARRLLAAGSAAQTLADLPVAAQQAISAAIGQDQSAYHAASAASGDPFVQQAKLTASNGAGGNEFGNSVAVSGNTIVVGAPQTATGVIGVGAVYIFTEPASGWANMTQTAELTPSNGAESDFGTSVAISGNTVVVGALFNFAAKVGCYQQSILVFLWGKLNPSSI